VTARDPATMTPGGTRSIDRAYNVVAHVLNSYYYSFIRRFA